jgi:hypothetical protein
MACLVTPHASGFFQGLRGTGMVAALRSQGGFDLDASKSSSGHRGPVSRAQWSTLSRFPTKSGARKGQSVEAQMMPVSPNVRDEAIAYLIPVFRISGQVPGKDFLLVRYAEIQYGQEDQDKQQRPPRAKRKRRADEEKKRAEIHRMSDQCIHASRDYLLSFFDAHICCRIGVHL